MIDINDIQILNKQGFVRNVGSGKSKHWEGFEHNEEGGE